MFFSVIIPVINYNSYLEKNLLYLSNQKFKDFEVIIVSENNFENLINKHDLNIKFVHEINKPNPGQKRNVGANFASGRYLVFIDDDAYPRIDWLEISYKNLLFYNNDKICLGGPGIICEDENFFGKCIDLFYTSDFFHSDSCRYKSILKLNKKEMQDWPSVNFIISKIFFQELSGFDIKYWPGEDSKLCEKVLKKEGKIIYIPDMITHHYKRSNLIKHLKQIFRYGKHRGIFFKDGDVNSKKFKYLIPSIFFLMHITMLINIKLFLLIINIYFAILILEILKINHIKKKFLFIVISRFYIYFSHLSYGIGFLNGLIKRNYKPSLYR